jgi:hypothetical protein
MSKTETDSPLTVVAPAGAKRALEREKKELEAQREARCRKCSSSSTGATKVDRHIGRGVARGQRVRV